MAAERLSLGVSSQIIRIAALRMKNRQTITIGKYLRAG